MRAELLTAREKKEKLAILEHWHRAMRAELLVARVEKEGLAIGEY